MAFVLMEAIGTFHEEREDTLGYECQKMHAGYGRTGRARARGILMHEFRDVRNLIVPGEVGFFERDAVGLSQQIDPPFPFHGASRMTF